MTQEVCNKCSKPKRTDSDVNPYAVCNCGRPTKYNDEILDICQEYLEDSVYRNLLPTADGLSLYLDVSRKTINNWADKHPEFI